jgi:hypothetical protein
MIAAPVQCDVDGIPKGSHYVLLKRANVFANGGLTDNMALEMTSE